MTPGAGAGPPVMDPLSSSRSKSRESRLREGWGPAGRAHGLERCLGGSQWVERHAHTGQMDRDGKASRFTEAWLSLQRTCCHFPHMAALKFRDTCDGNVFVCVQHTTVSVFLNKIFLIWRGMSCERRLQLMAPATDCRRTSGMRKPLS